MVLNQCKKRADSPSKLILLKTIFMNSEEKVRNAMTEKCQFLSSLFQITSSKRDIVRTA